MPPRFSAGPDQNTARSDPEARARISCDPPPNRYPSFSHAAQPTLGAGSLATHHRLRSGRRNLPDRAQQALLVGAALIAHTIDEEGRGPPDAAVNATAHISL